jgi:GNAT superfamily N-acetyltransferase
VLSVTPATRHDAPAIAELLDEIDRFYGATDIDPVGRRAAQIEAALFRDQPVAYVLLARDSDKVVGMAAYSFLWPAAGVTQSLYLKELYVTARHRRRGVGRLLIDKLRQTASESGCSRIEWTTDEDNPDAQRFYEKLGFHPHRGKILFRIPIR